MCSCGASQKQYLELTKKVGNLPGLLYLRCAYKSQFDALFLAQGIKVTDENLPVLAQMADTGGDLAGEVQGPNGPIKFSVMKTIQGIDISKPENSTCQVPNA
jgi:hypothetical protein